MEKYLVLVRFKDLEDGERVYQVGDTYPREGLKPTKKRITELTTEKNRRKKVLIEEIKVIEPDGITGKNAEIEVKDGKSTDQKSAK